MHQPVVYAFPALPPQIPGEHRRLPEVFVGREQVAVLAERREAHTIGMRLENLIPAPHHIAVHVVRDLVAAAQKESLVLEDGSIPGRDGARVDRLGVRAWAVCMISAHSAHNARKQ